MASPSSVGPSPLGVRTGQAPIISVDDLSKRFGAFWALRGATFSIRPGEILGLIGPNGSGKSTLFQCLAGITPASIGTVKSNGAAVAPGERKRILYFVPTGFVPGLTKPS